MTIEQEGCCSLLTGWLKFFRFAQQDLSEQKSFSVHHPELVEGGEVDSQPKQHRLLPLLTVYTDIHSEVLLYDDIVVLHGTPVEQLSLPHPSVLIDLTLLQEPGFLQFKVFEYFVISNMNNGLDTLPVSFSHYRYRELIDSWV